MSVPVTLYFKHKDGPGWSEGYRYTPQTGDFATNASDIRQLATLRAAMLTKDCTITHARAGTTTKRLVTVVPLMGGAGQPGAIAPPTMPLECALLFVLQTPAYGYNRLYVRGFDRASVDGETLTASSDFNSAAGVWENYLMTSGLWYIYGSLGSPTTHIALTNLVPTKPRGIQATAALNAISVGDVVTIHAATVPGYNGRKTCMTVTPATGSAQYTFGGAAPAADDESTVAYATKEVFFDQAIQQVFFDKVTRRGPGRPFGLSRGRRQTTYSLRP
jgi:hypothetical protein